MFPRRLKALPWISDRSSIIAPNRSCLRPSLWYIAPWICLSAATWTAAASIHNSNRAQQRDEKTALKKVSPQLNTRYEDLYAKVQKNSSTRRAISGTFSQSNQELKDSIASGKIDPVQHMKHTLQTPLRDVDVGIIRASIAGEMERVCAVPRHKRKSMVRTGFARLILLRLFEAEPTVWRLLMSSDSDSMIHLCYFALFEGLEDTLLGWLNVNLGQDAFSTTSHFRNDLLRNIVHAHLMKDETHSADDAIRCFFKVDDMALAVKRQPRSQTKDDGLLKLSVWPACTALCTELGSGKVHQTSTQLFDKFVDFFARYSKKKRGEDYRLAREYNIATMRISHPTSPDHSPALEVFRELDVGLQHASATEVRHWLPASPNSQRDFCFRVWQLALGRGQTEDAAFVDALSEKLYGSRSSKRPKKGPKGKR